MRSLIFIELIARSQHEVLIGSKPLHLCATTERCTDVIESQQHHNTIHMAQQRLVLLRISTRSAFAPSTGQASS